MGPTWTQNAALPGGEIVGADFSSFLAQLTRQKPFLKPAVARRLARAYGTRVWRLLGEARGMADLGEDFGHGLTTVELRYLVQEEWARSAEDVLWRRSKIGLHLSEAQRGAVAAALPAIREALTPAAHP